jgi:hypothetical protein
LIGKANAGRQLAFGRQPMKRMNAFSPKKSKKLWAEKVGKNDFARLGVR